MKAPSAHSHEHTPFSYLRFIIVVLVTMVLYYVAFRLIAPEIWQASLQSPCHAWLIVFLAVHLGCAFIEYLFHRYVLHYPVFPPFKYFCDRHRLHHGLTPIFSRPEGADPVHVVDAERIKVHSRFPIREPRQHEASYFPWYSLAVFLALALMVLIPVQMLLTDWPIIMMAPIAIAWSISLYEILHNMQHMPEEVWERNIRKPATGWYYRMLYCPHQRHHGDVMTNMGISGFFGVPVFDYLFGTYSVWGSVLKDKDSLRKEEFELPKHRPYWPIRMLDKLLIEGLGHRRPKKSAD